MTTDARRLAEWLAARGDDVLATLFIERSVPVGVGWNDFFDAAEALLEPTAVARAVERLAHAEASALRAGQPSAVLRDVALADAEGIPFAVVVAAARGREIAPLPDAAPATVSETDAAHAAERAFTHLVAVAELLLAIRDVPLALLTGGAPTAVERKRLADALPPGIEPAEVVATAIDADIAATAERELRLTERGERWLSQAAAPRWAVLAEGFRAALPRSIRAADGGWVPPHTWSGAEPWNPGWAEASAVLRGRAELLGIVTPEGAELAWATALGRGRPTETAELEKLLPQEVDRIFLQNDLTAIAPGPLAPMLDLRLRAAAERESAAQASSYRFTAESLARALALGENAQSLREFLASLSLTGIPQPLDYLLERTAQRHGLVQVRGNEGRTRVRSDDPHLIETMLIDHALRHLGLTALGDDLVSRVNAASVTWALTEARYPAVHLGEDGQPVQLRRQAASPVPAAEPTDVHAPLIARLRASHGPDAEAAWLSRALEAAVQVREVLVVEVGMPDGSSRELTLEVTGVGGGRLRGTDRAADVERTLPISHIRSIRPVG